jgi:hypothetical protein
MSIKRIGIISKPKKTEIREIVPSLTQWLRERNVEVFLDKETASLLESAERSLSRNEMPSQVDLLVVLGGIAALSEAIYIAAFNSPSTLMSSIPLPLGALAALMMVYGFFAVFGGALATMRIYWSMAFLGAVCSMVAIGWFYLSLLFGAIGLILLVKTKEEFD